MMVYCRVKSLKEKFKGRFNNERRLLTMNYKFEDLKKADKLRVTLEGLPASEIRRVAENLNITPDMLVKSLVVKGLRDNYGIVVE